MRRAFQSCLELVLEFVVLALQLSQKLLVVALGAVKRLNALTLVFDELLVGEQVFLHGLPAFVHFLHSRQLGQCLFVLSLQEGDLRLLVHDYCIFLVQLGLQHVGCHREFGDLVGELCEFFLHNL